MAENLNMVGLIDHLTPLILDAFPETYSQAYFGDVGVYPPKAFQDGAGNQRSVLVFVPHKDEMVKRAGNAEQRKLGLLVVVMVNMVPFFEALPQEAFGERMLVENVLRLRAFLSADENFSLGGRVLSTTVGDIDWSWQQRGASAYRAAAIQYEALVQQPR